jgi:hypothetical protein
MKEGSIKREKKKGPVLFKKSLRRFNDAWWAYSFPLTFLALAPVEYAQKLKGDTAFGPMLVLVTPSVMVFLGLMLLTALKSTRLLRENDPILSFFNKLKRTETRPHKDLKHKFGLMIYS